MICYPPGADWTTVYSQDEIDAMRADEAISEKMDTAEALAWMSLATLTADRIGTCPITIRPCAAGCSPAGTWTEAPVGSGSFAGVLPGHSYLAPYVGAQGQWYNACGCSTTACHCGSALSEVLLPGPVGRIVEVMLDGEVVDPATYRVDDGTRLVSLDPDRPWPSCQDLLQDKSGPDAFAVTYYRGAAPDGLILKAAGMLAAELYKGSTGERGCRLPSGTRSIVRQGISMEIQNDMFEDGRTGIREVDMLIARLNPFRLKVRPVVASPDSRRARMVS